MKTNFLILIVFILSLFIEPAFSRGSPRPIPTPPPIITAPTTAVAGVHFSPIKNYTVEETEVLKVSEQLANDLFKSKCFENFMVNRKLIDTNGKTPLEVVNDLKSKDLTVPVVMYSAWYSKVIGYRQPPKPDVYTNRKYHAGATACSRGSNLTHEWSHTAGYGHSYAATPTRPFSVPYSINAAFTVCCKCQNDSIKKCSILP